MSSPKIELYIRDLTDATLQHLDHIINPSLNLRPRDAHTIELVEDNEVVACLKVLSTNGAPSIDITPLSDKQREILELILVGLSNRAIGERLGISDKGVEYHVTLILRKLNLKSRTQLIRHALTG